jgi:hypothetical protein
MTRAPVVLTPIEQAVMASYYPNGRARELRFRLLNGREVVGKPLLVLEDSILVQPRGRGFYFLFGPEPVEIHLRAIASVRTWRFNVGRLVTLFVGVVTVVAIAADRTGWWFGSPSMREEFGLPWSERTSLLIICGIAVALLVLVPASTARWARRWTETVAAQPAATDSR